MKLAVTRVVRGFRRTATLDSGQHRITQRVVKYERVWTEPRRRFGRQWWDAQLLPLIGALSKQTRIELLWSFDANREFCGLPKRDSPDGLFFGVPLTWVDAPITHGAFFINGRFDWGVHQLAWLQGINDPRFLELRKLVRAEPGSGNFRNQLIDAVLVWSAEHVQATHFLTCDYKLVDAMTGGGPSSTVKIVTPMQLMAELAGRNVLCEADVRAETLRRLRSMRKLQAASGVEELADQGDFLDRRGFYD